MAKAIMGLPKITLVLKKIFVASWTGRNRVMSTQIELDGAAACLLRLTSQLVGHHSERAEAGELGLPTPSEISSIKN
jgi:hypothetical protein